MIEEQLNVGGTQMRIAIQSEKGKLERVIDLNLPEYRISFVGEGVYLHGKGLGIYYDKYIDALVYKKELEQNK